MNSRHLFLTTVRGDNRNSNLVRWVRRDEIFLNQVKSIGDFMGLGPYDGLWCCP